MPPNISLPSIHGPLTPEVRATTSTESVATSSPQRLSIIESVNTVSNVVPDNAFAIPENDFADETILQSTSRRVVAVAQEIVRNAGEQLSLQQASHNLYRLLEEQVHLEREMLPLYEVIMDIAGRVSEQNSAQFIQNISINIARDILLQFDAAIRSAAHENALESVTRDLQTIVNDWIAHTPGADFCDGKADWTSFNNEAGAIKFAQFLESIEAKGMFSVMQRQPNVNAASIQFRHSVISLLSAIAVSPGLRAQVFSLAAEGLDTCQDRITLMFNHMKVAQLHEEVKAGKYDQQLPQLIDIARQTFRLNAISDIAVSKLHSFSDNAVIDEVEIYLAYQTLASKQLSLSVVAPEMAYRGAAAVSDKEIEIAIARIKQDEDRCFAGFLQTWEPWQTLLARIEPQAYSAAIEQRDNAIENIQARLQERLSTEGQPSTPTSVKIWGVLLTKELTEDAFFPTTNALLTKHNLLSLLDPVWKDMAQSSNKRLQAESSETIEATETTSSSIASNSADTARTRGVDRSVRENSRYHPYAHSDVSSNVDNIG